MSIKKIGILTGGGDCPGLNAVIRAVTKYSELHNIEVIGFKDGWKGLLDKRYIDLNHKSVSGLIHKGGTILGTSRTNALKDQETIDLVINNFSHLSLEALVVIGGEGTLTVGSEFHKLGLPIIGVPKTIDNDISKTDFTFGFDTAVSIATEAIDRLHTTAESHNRIMIVEVMGRHAGWIATYAGIAGGADAVLIPEFPLSVEEITKIIEKRKAAGKLFSIIVVAEGAPIVEQQKQSFVHKKIKDDFGRPRLGGIAEQLAQKLEEKLNIECRVTVLGYVQRGGTPSAADRVLATRYGHYAVDLVLKKKFGQMVCLNGTKLSSVNLKEATTSLKKVNKEIWDVAKTFFN